MTKLDLLFAMRYGIPEGESMASVTAAFQRHVLESTIKRDRFAARAAKSLGITRGGLYKMRKRVGRRSRFLRTIGSVWQRRRPTPTTAPTEVSMASCGQSSVGSWGRRNAHLLRRSLSVERALASAE